MSITAVSGSISTKVILPPQYLMQFADAAKVIGVEITLDFSVTPNASAQRCRAAVPLDTATAYLASTYEAKASSNSLIFGP